jgi:hypothetical protein
MMDDEALEHRIRERAFNIWLDEGCPDGRDQEHWQQAQRELSGEAGFASDAPPLQPEPIGQIRAAEERLVDGGEGQPPSEKR